MNVETARDGDDGDISHDYFSRVYYPGDSAV